MTFHFEKSLKIATATYPFVLLRLLVYGLAILATVLWFSGTYLLFRHWPFPGPNWLAWVAGGVLWGSGAKLLRNYILYIVKAAHIAVITHLVVVGDLPSGTGQFFYGKNVVFKHFLQVSLLFAVDQLVKVVLRAFNRSIFSLVAFVPGTRALRKFVQRVLDYSLGYIDEAILSYSLTKPEANPWSTARDGLVLYAQNWKTVLGSGVILALISYGLVAVFAVPGILLSIALPGPIGKVAVGIGLGLGVLVKFVLMDPFALVSVIVNYHQAISGQSVDPQWIRKLNGISDKFGQFESAAVGWKTAPGGPPPGPTVA